MSVEDDILDAHTPKAQPLRVLIFDVETAPLHSYHWKVWQENIQPHQLQNKTWLLCWAAKWEGQKTVHSDVVTPDEALEESDGRIVESLARLIRQADIVIAHNVDRFDLPVLNTRLLDLRLEPLPPVRTVDTLKVAKRAFRFVYNRLNYLAEFLGHDLKHPMVFADWLGAVKGDRKALSKMRHYCKQDVLVLEKVWYDLRPYARNVPRMMEGARPMHRACPVCGSEDLTPAGWHRTNASNFARFKCESCGRLSRVRSAAQSKKLGLHPL